MAICPGSRWFADWHTWGAKCPSVRTGGVDVGTRYHASVASRLWTRTPSSIWWRRCFLWPLVPAARTSPIGYVVADANDPLLGPLLQPEDWGAPAACGSSRCPVAANRKATTR